VTLDGWVWRPRHTLDHQSITKVLASDTLVEVTEDTPRFTYSDTLETELTPGREVQGIERLHDLIRTRVNANLSTPVLAWADSVAKEHTEDEPWPGGWLVVNAQTYVVGPQTWEGFEEECQRTSLRYGEFGTWEGMRCFITRFTAPNRIYHFGPKELVGRLCWTLDITYNVEQSTGSTFAVDVEMEGFILPAENPQVGVTILQEPATTVH